MITFTEKRLVQIAQICPKALKLLPMHFNISIKEAALP